MEVLRSTAMSGEDIVDLVDIGRVNKITLLETGLVF